jgi:hypothetical protein
MRLFWPRRLWLDFRMGRCSGFPDCCILFFISVWRPVYGDLDVSPSDKVKWRKRFLGWYMKKAGNFKCGYVPCPLCIMSGARVEVRKCTPECGHYSECHRL